MAVMMVLTAWVFFEPTKASAAATTYKYRFRVYVDNDYSSDNSGYYTIKGRATNGTGGDVTIKNKVALNADCFSSNKGQTVYVVSSATSTSFPYSFEIYTWKDTSFFGIGQFTAYLDVYSGSSWVTICSQQSNSQTGKGEVQASASLSDSSLWPKATTISWTDTPEDMICPTTGTETQSVAVSAVDQYDVQMYAPTYSVKGSVCGTDGISVSSSGQISLTNAANTASGTVKQQTGTVTATWGTVTNSKTFTITDTTYTATFNYKNGSGADTSTTRTGFHGVTISAPSVPEYDDGDNHYTFSTSWDPAFNSTLTANATYNARYIENFVIANYDAVESAKQAVADFKAADPEYDLKYTQASRDAVENAISSVAYGLGRTKQNIVDGYAEAITNALEALKTSINVYDVIFLDENNTILKYEKDVVYGSPVTAPADPEMYFDGTNHYTFSSWDSTEYDYVQDDLIVKPVFTEAAHTYTTETVDSTCTTKGCTKHTCTFCGYSYTDGETDLAAHSFASEYTVDLEPTCTTAGSKSRHCTVCDAQTDNTEIPATGHDFDVNNDGIDDETVLTAATCLGQGVSTKTCEKCGVVANVIHPAKGHNYDTDDDGIDNETVVAPTCVAKGYTLHTCKDCGYSYTDNFVDKIDHAYVKNTDESKAADCVHDGAEVSYCSVCGSKDVKILPATGHDWDATGVVTVEPTCDTIGSKEYTCKNDSSHTYSEIIPAKGHNYDTNNDGVVTEADGAETAAPGCVTTGVRTYTCLNDNTHTYIEIIPALDHEWETVYTTDLEPTCEVAGSKSIHCSRCDAIKAGTETEISATDHTPTTIITEAPTCTENGYKAEKCSVCGALLGDITMLPATGHQYNEGTVVREADAGNNGLIEYTCSVCGDKFYEEYVLDSTVHSWKVEVITAASCETTGLEKYTCIKTDCTVCTADNKVSFTKQTPALGHDLSETVVDATCTADGSKTVTCSRGDYSETTAIPALGHNYVAGMEVPAGCETPGYVPYTCSRCGESYNELTDNATGHTWDAGTEIQAPTADKYGIMKYVCEKCDAEKTATIAPTGPHTFTLTSETAPDCENAGEKVWTCTAHTNCPADYTEVLPATGHNMIQDGEAVAATCESPELTKFICANNCGKTETVVTSPALRHDWGEWKVITPATCSERGVMTRTCKNDPTHTQTKKTDGYADHDFVATVVERTCTEPGFTILACKGCGKAIRTNFIPAEGHKYDEGVYEDAACTTPGGIRYTCTNTNPDGSPCGHSYLVKDTEPLGHVWGAWHYVSHPTTQNAYAKRRDCTRGGCTVVEYERNSEDDINVYYKVEFYNPWTTDEYYVLNNGKTKLAKTYKTEMVTEGYYLVGNEVTYPSRTVPVREKDYTCGDYRLDGWLIYDKDGQLVSAADAMKAISGNLEVYAAFKAYDKYYNVAFWNGGEQITRDEPVLHGRSAQYRPLEDPKKADNLFYRYEFTGWDYDYTAIYDDVAIHAVYNEIPKTYTIEYYDWNGDFLTSEEFAYDAPAKNNPTNLKRTENATYIYEFSGKWQTQPGKEEYINLEHLRVPVGTPDGGTIKVYAKYYQKAKEYTVNVHGYGINKELIPGATVQIFSSNGQIVSTTKLNENSDVTLTLYYDTAYEIVITDEYGNIGSQVIELNTTMTDKDTGKLVPTEVTIYLKQYTDPDHGGSDCHCICHSFLGRFWISMLNMIYRLFGKKIVCCYDMFATHGDQLLYGQ